MKVRKCSNHVVIGEGQRVVRLYLLSTGEVKVDTSQIQDLNWPAYQAFVKKFGMDRTFDLSKLGKGFTLQQFINCWAKPREEEAVLPKGAEYLRHPFCNN